MVLAILFFIGAAPSSVTQRAASPRVVAIGDIHGNFDAFSTSSATPESPMRAAAGSREIPSSFRPVTIPTGDRKFGQSWISSWTSSGRRPRLEAGWWFSSATTR